MKKIFLLTAVALSTAFFLSQCKKLSSAVQDGSSNNKSISVQKTVNDFNNKQWSPQLLGALNTKIARYKALKDTNNMDPTKIPASINYQVRYNAGDAQLIKAQRAFIKGSGFLLVDQQVTVKDAEAAGIAVTSNSTVNGIQLALMTDDFEGADARYKAFVSNNSSNGFLPVFKQDAANLIIRKYLLNNASKTAELNTYLGDLINSGSQDYPLIYLALNKLKDQVPATALNSYKAAVATNKDAQKFRQQLKLEHDNLVRSAATLGGRLSQVLNLQASMLEIPQAQATYFMNKIKGVSQSSVNM
ncbi:hypothetical protein [Mucilaginibacter sp. dw_454]|uniref:hypothetical protein n=1 Tax=Mucilaginibacter sp. dw_454 TaxID=2720079 RepID=UPI001BD43985|nr:hypothetical protein [Mucilaginibacter sp. dw_454]